MVIPQQVNYKVMMFEVVDVVVVVMKILIFG